MVAAQVEGTGSMFRRDVLRSGLSAAALAGVSRAARAAPAQAVWPDEAAWSGLKTAVGGRLAPVVPPDLSDPAVRKFIADPFYVGGEPGLTQSSGWLDAWRSTPSRYVVAARDAADVAATVRFARQHGVRLVVRGGGHSYLGASNAPDSLMLWTRPMSAIAVHEGFTPQGSKAAPAPAVSVGAGAVWLHAYQAVSVGAGRYVQGGGCTTVGVAGLVQGGGFGSFSKRYGTVAQSLLEAEMVTADGALRVVNAARDPDLFWALKGGGGGTFGVVTRVTLATHPLPQTFGGFNTSIRAASDEAYRRLLARFIDLYATNLCNPHWGEQAIARPDNRLDINMVFQDLTPDAARGAWQPLVDFVKANPSDYMGGDKLLALPIPARRFWDADFMRPFAGAIVAFDTRPGASATDFWWAGDGEQVGAFWHAYASAWMPSSLLKPANQPRLVDAWFSASRHQGVSFHFNKGLFGATPDVVAGARGTAMNPGAADAFALAITAAAGPAAYDGLPPPNAALAATRRDRVQAAIAALRAAAPDAGAYVNECDYFQPDWRRAFWGANYARLERVKRRVDPTGLFRVHHGVGEPG
jgi:FAD/FMN-containing dehydrogenase